MPVRPLLAACLTLASLPLCAAEPATVTWYDVELIVFRNLDTRSTETWPPDAGVPAIADARALFPPQGPQSAAEPAPATPAPLGVPTPYVPLDPAQHQLTGVMNSLQRSSKYEPLLHVAWTQPPLEREQSPYLRLTLPGTIPAADAQERVAEEAPLLGRSTDSQPDVPPETPEFLAGGNDAPELSRPLDGVVQLSVSRYLHLDLDLIYLPADLNLDVLGEVPAATRAWTEEERREREARHRAILDALARGDITLEEAEILALEPEQQVFNGFRLDQYRRMRSRELHYFDHPVYGVIAMVTPREVPAPTMDGMAPGVQ